MIEIKVPSPGESITEVLLDKWHKPSGTWVEKDDLIAEIQSDKAALEVYAEAAGRLEILVEAGTQVPVGTVIARIDPAAERSTAPSSTNGETSAPSTTSPAAEEKTQPTVMPSAARILAEKGIPAQQVTGTGPAGRITKEDALQAQPTKPAEPSPAPAAPAPALSTPSAAPVPMEGRQEIRKKLTPIRQTIVRRLLAAKNQTAMLTTFNEV
ncbi:MAG: biotin/lipoyl-containing protein, partial [Candidatus Methanosuratincola sp.]